MFKNGVIFSYRMFNLSVQKFRLFSTNRTIHKRLSYFYGASDTPLIGTTIGRCFDKTANENPNKEAIVVRHQGIRKTFSQLQNDVSRLAAGFLALGLSKGERIGIWGPNSYEWVLTQFAAAKAGLILVNINPAYQPRELEYCLNKVQVRTLVSAEYLKTQDYFHMLNSIAPEIETSKPGGIESKKLPHLKNLIMLSNKEHSGAFKFSDIPELSDMGYLEKLEERGASIDLDDAANIQFTSGTTGNPKGATLSHHNIVNNSYFIGLRMGYHLEEHVVCISVPLYHCFGCVVGTMIMATHATKQVLPAATFQATECLAAIQQEKCTMVYGTPTMFVDMLNNPNCQSYQVHKYLKGGCMAGATCPEELVKNVITTMGAKDIVILYGTTELSPAILVSEPGECVKNPSTVGKAMHHTEIKVTDAEGKIVPCGVPGEVCSRGYSTFLGYWDDEAKTKETMKNGWYHTGDIGVMREDGLGEIVGRIKDMIIRGGENIYPKEIEEFIYTHPKIVDATVVGIPDKRMGEELCIWIRLKDGVEMTEEEVKSFCKGQISHFKIPKYILFVDEFPKTVTGKIQKFKIREQMIKQLNL